MIWNRVPKANLVGAAILNLGVYYATVHFKDFIFRNFKTTLVTYRHLTGCLNPKLKNEQLSDIAERKKTG